MHGFYLASMTSMLVFYLSVFLASSYAALQPTMPAPIIKIYTHNGKKAEKKENIVKQGIEKKRKFDQLFDLIGKGNLREHPIIEEIIKEDPAK